VTVISHIITGVTIEAKQKKNNKGVKYEETWHRANMVEVRRQSQRETNQSTANLGSQKTQKENPGEQSW
jgi:L-asparaginase/Glu-tRNA(Gln) amidotransferase subunit D